jgi:hypothetical protein
MFAPWKIFRINPGNGHRGGITKKSMSRITMVAALEETYLSNQFILCIDTRINKQGRPVWAVCFDLTQSSVPAVFHAKSSSGKGEKLLEAID